MPADGGIRFGPYVLLRRIARGGMAEVFLAQQRGLEGFDRRVAVKRILPHLADSPDFVKMFFGEAKLAALLTHPNIVHIYDFGKVDQDYFIAMEFVDGIHTGQAFKIADRPGERLSPTLVARIGADAATALHYAHELTNPQGQALGLVHRDISPANIMVSYDGVVKLCDFGIAKAAAFTDQLTQPGQVKGKYAYMSPEQTIAAPLDGRSDVFALGIVLWELLAGTTIVPRGDAVDAMRAIRDGKLPRLAVAAPDTPEPLASAITWALETKRERRATAAELATALEAFIKSSPELAGPLQLAGWVRSRFPRSEPSGPQASLPRAGGPRTQAAPETQAVPGTQASRIVPVTPHGEAPVTQDDDNSETLIAPGPERASVETTAQSAPFADSETFLDGATLERGGAERAFVPNANAIPARAVPAVSRAPGGTPELERPRIVDPTLRAPRLLSRRRIYLAGSMFALAMISFSIVLCVKSPATRAVRPDTGVVAVVADAAVAVANDAVPGLVPDAAADRTTILKVNTRPSHGTVRVGDQIRTAPAELALPAGKHAVRIELDGWEPETREVDLPYGVDTVLEMAFSRRIASRPPPDKPTGRLTVRTTPWSDVYIGTRKIGQAPFADLDMPAGTYTLLFKHPTREPVRRTVTITPNKTTKLSFSL